MLENKLGLTNFSELAESVFRKIKLKDGYVKVPQYWIILGDPQKAMESRYAGVVEVKNGHRFDAPHFVFFSNIKYAEDYPDEMKNEILEQCVKEVPRFQEIIERCEYLKKYASNRQDDEGYMKGPEIGFFNIFEENDPSLREDYIPPYACMIVRDDGR